MSPIPARRCSHVTGLDELSGSVMSLVARETASRASEFEPRGLSNVAWALSRADGGGVSAGDRAAAMEAIAKQVASRAQQFQGGEISTLVASFARVSHPAPMMFSAVGGQLKVPCRQPPPPPPALLSRPHSPQGRSPHSPLEPSMIHLSTYAGSNAVS